MSGLRKPALVAPLAGDQPEGPPDTTCALPQSSAGLGATIEGAGTGVVYKLTENNGHFAPRPFKEGLVIMARSQRLEWDSRFREASQRAGRIHGRRG